MRALSLLLLVSFYCLLKFWDNNDVLGTFNYKIVKNKSNENSDRKKTDFIEMLESCIFTNGLNFCTIFQNLVC